MEPLLYIVPTPIGNLEDLTFRALRVLQSVDRIVAEDTRHTLKLLQHYDIHKPLTSYHEHSPPQRLAELLGLLTAGSRLALVSDAGTPGISDPGRALVQGCWERGVVLEVLPGACACITALVSSGLETGRFVFEGFLPARGRERQERLAQCQHETRTLIFYEGPHHLRQTLQDLIHWLGTDRELVLARELTKLHAQVWRGTLAQALVDFPQPRGEFTLVVQGRAVAVETVDDAFLQARLAELLARGLSPSAASRLVAQQTGISRNHIYQLTLSTHHNKEGSLEDPG
ncbi:16S rRNA (cytidine(1402)-2'-O)-methyltransferase [Candidatus Cyanaurora vandensis]|uniref:16S rRNA (cytidine(1402)-2'-O)-methyltransferase n=1 Tax=Candidatus Cyanaurora vandensis TaxID=2714958 RepID=UPI00257A2D72|nr:16S rRNA (cytidine(1402)-2'-O)-methyltransferase [Candidatus Cyanaurora vandensis]